MSEAVPVAVTGIAGPGAPHVFQFNRRESLGYLLVHVALLFLWVGCNDSAVKFCACSRLEIHWLHQFCRSCQVQTLTLGMSTGTCRLNLAMSFCAPSDTWRRRSGRPVTFICQRQSPESGHLWACPMLWRLATQYQRTTKNTSSSFCQCWSIITCIELPST